MNQPYRGFKEKAQNVPFPFLVGACTLDAGDKGAFIDLPGQGCVDMRNGRLHWSHGGLICERISMTGNRRQCLSGQRLLGLS